MTKCSRLKKDLENRRQHNYKDVRNFFRLQNQINDTIIKDIKNLFRLTKEVDNTTIKDMRNLIRLKKENEAIKDRVIRDIRDLLEHEEEGHYKPLTVGNLWSNNYIK